MMQHKTLNYFFKDENRVEKLTNRFVDYVSQEIELELRAKIVQNLKPKTTSIEESKEIDFFNDLMLANSHEAGDFIPSKDGSDSADHVSSLKRAVRKTLMRGYTIHPSPQTEGNINTRDS